MRKKNKMNIQWKDYMKDLQKQLMETNYIKPGLLPDIDLYMDQVISFMDAHLESTKRFEDDKLLTKTMINNYTKNDLIPPPDKKKYSKDHMYLLIFIYYMKNFLSISDVKSIIAPMADMFCKDKGDISLEEIYNEIYDMEYSSSFGFSKDVMKKFVASKKTFTQVNADDERDYLQMFSFIAMLSFDVYLKRNLIEAIIDDVLTEKPEAEKKPEKKTEKKPEKKAEKKPEKQPEGTQVGGPGGEPVAG